MKKLRSVSFISINWQDCRFRFVKYNIECVVRKDSNKIVVDILYFVCDFSFNR